jgi:hypothetical protein
MFPSTTRFLFGLWAAGVAAACTSSTSVQPPGRQAPCAPGSVGCSATNNATGNVVGAAVAGSTGMVAGPVTGAAGSSVGRGVASPAPGAAGSTAATPGSKPAAVSGGVPCDVAPIISQHCTLCHAAAPKFGAPMSLMTAADFQAMSHSMPSMPVYQVAPGRLNATDPSKRMPPVSATALSPTELQTLGAWLTGGAKPASPGCPVTETSAQPVGGGAVSSGSGGASITPIDYQDPDMKCYKLLVHAQGDVNKPYMQSPGEEYVDVSFKAPWTGTVYSRAIKVVLDPNSKVLHHWLLFKDTTMKPDGSVTPVGLLGVHTDGAVLLHGWAPGASDVYLDPDVGMKLEGNVSYTLEAHLNNSGAVAGGDHSGAEICVTTKVPAHIADISWVGTDNIAGTTAQGTCTPHGNDPIHVIAAQPHMHLKGTHMKVVINHKTGMAETIHDTDFSFENQRYYVEHSIMMPGDTMTTTCTYSAPATFGPSTNAEMCYFFTLHWPGGAIGGPSLIHGANTCVN